MGKQKRKPNTRLSTVNVAKIMVFTACLNIIIALSALVLGLWIDDMMGWRGLATVILMVISFPLSLFFMVRLALMLVNRFATLTSSQVRNEASQDKEE